jgi:hypothetical protein
VARKEGGSPKTVSRAVEFSDSIEFETEHVYEPW